MSDAPTEIGVPTVEHRPEVIDTSDYVFKRMADPGRRVSDPWSPEYRTPEFMSEAIAELQRTHGDPTQSMGVYFLDGRDPRSSLGRAIELERFGDSFDNDAGLLRQLYGDFENAGVTELICVVDHELGRPAGVIRTVRNTAEHGCRILNDLQADGPDGWGLSWDEIQRRADFLATEPLEILDIPTIAVGKDYAGSRKVDGVSKALSASVLQHALRSEAVTWVCSLDRIPYQLIQIYGGDVMEEFEGIEGQPYYGAEDTVPLWCNLVPYEERLRTTRPDLYCWLIDNEGLEDYFFAWPETLVDVIDLTEAAPTSTAESTSLID
jgi:hypothetical protein